MTQDRKRIRTPIVRGEEAWFDDEVDVSPQWRKYGKAFGDFIVKFSEGRNIVELDSDLYWDFIRNKLRERIVEPSSYATRQDLEDLRKNLVSLVEEKFQEAKSHFDLSNFDPAIDLAVSRIQKLDEVTRICYHTENKSLELYLRIQEFSEDILEKITRIEIEVSRRYPGISIELIPILTDEEIARGCHEIRAKQ